MRKNKVKKLIKDVDTDSCKKCGRLSPLKTLQLFKGNLSLRLFKKKKDCPSFDIRRIPPQIRAQHFIGVKEKNGKAFLDPPPLPECDCVLYQKESQYR